MVVDDRFAEFNTQVDRAVNQALFTAAQHGVRSAQDKRPRRSPVDSHQYKTEKIQARTVATTPKRNARGTEISLINSDPRGVWFELGTLTRRRGRKLTKATLARRASLSGRARLAKVAGHPGVLGNRFLAAGMKETKKRFQDELDRLLPG